MNLNEMTKHLRKRLSHEGIKARVYLTRACGREYINVDPAEYGKNWTPEQAKMIAFIADVNELTYPEGSPINLDPAYWAEVTEWAHFTFQFGARRRAA